jgi:hypothetical protein
LAVWLGKLSSQNQTSEEEQEKMSVDFWKSDAGLSARIEMLSEQIIWKSFNNAMQAYAGESGIKVLEWVTMIGPNTCNYCDGQSGRRYRVGQFMPQIPAHPSCRCHWDILVSR